MMAGSLPDEAALAALYPPTLQLVLVQVVHRHGERSAHGGEARTGGASAIFNPFRTIQWVGPDGRGLCAVGSALSQLSAARLQLDYEDRPPRPSGQCLPGQLSDVGRTRMASLGARLRALYVDRLGFLPARYSPAAVLVRSTEIPRAIESAQAVVVGLYPDTATRTAPPVAVAVREEQSEYLYPNFRQCPQLRSLMETLRKPGRDRHRSELARLRDLLHAHLLTASELGGSAATAHDMYDALASARAHGVALPAGVSGAVYQTIERMAVDHWWTPYADSDRAVRLGVGRFVGQLVATMDPHVGAVAAPTAPAGTTAVAPPAAGPGVALGMPLAPTPASPSRRLCLYSAHDSTLAPLLLAFRVYDGLWPEFGAHVSLELLKATAGADHYVRLLYNHRPLALPECADAARASGVDATLCPYERFRALAARFVPVDHRAECQLDGADMAR